MPGVALPPTPPPAGHGRLVLDTVDGPMQVTAQSDPTFRPPDAAGVPLRSGELCRTPCAADLPYGRYRLFLTGVGTERGDSDDVTVAEGLNVYRRAPGTYTTPTITNQIAPMIVTVLGAALFGAGIYPLALSKDSSGRTAGVVMMGAGLALGVGGGLWLYDTKRAVQQDGATTTWREPIR